MDPPFPAHFIDSITAYLKGGPQLPYGRLNFADYAKELAPRPVHNSPRTAVPEHFSAIFPSDTMITVQSVSDAANSFWHSLLYVLYPSCRGASWRDRQELVNKLISELESAAEHHFKEDAILSHTSLHPDTICYREPLVSNLLLHYICSLLDINIIVVDTVRTCYHFRDTSYNPGKPTIILYRDDKPMYRPISLNGEVIIIYAMPDVDLLNKGAPKFNTLLQEATKFRSRDGDGGKIGKKVIGKDTTALYAEVNGLSPAELQALKYRETLGKLKVCELQELARRLNVDTTYESPNGAPKRKLKSQLIEDIIQESTQ